MPKPIHEDNLLMSNPPLPSHHLAVAGLVIIPVSVPTWEGTHYPEKVLGKTYKQARARAAVQIAVDPLFWGEHVLELGR